MVGNRKLSRSARVKTGRLAIGAGPASEGEKPLGSSGQLGRMMRHCGGRNGPSRHSLLLLQCQEECPWLLSDSVSDKSLEYYMYETGDCVCLPVCAGKYTGELV